MQYILQINQHAANSLGLIGKLDAIDLLLFDFVYHMMNDPKVPKTFIDGCEYSDIRVNLVTQQCPVLGINNRETFRKRILKLVDASLIERYANNGTENTSLYKRGRLFSSLTSIPANDCLHPANDCLHNHSIDNINNNSSSSTDKDISTTSNISITTKKEEKKTSKEKTKSFDLSFVGIAYADAFNMWLEHKRQTHDAYKTQRGVELCYRKLLEYSNNDPNIFAKIIEQSIANNWKGLYELKDNNQNNKRYGRNGFNDPEETMRLIIEGAKAGYAERSAAKGTL